MTLSLLENPASFTLQTSTLVEALERSAKDGAHVWLATKDADAVEVTLARVLEQATGMARHLVANGFQRGDRAVVMLPTSEAWLTAFFGTLLAGGIAIPVGPNLSFGGMDRYAETVGAIFRAAGARFLLGNEAIEPHVDALKKGDSPIEHFVRADQPGSFVGKPNGHAKALPTPSSDDPAVIQYTSGTTGVPKGVVLSNRALLANAHMIGERSGMSTADVGVSWLPLFHDMGLVGALLTNLYWRFPLLMMPVESFLLQPRRWVQWMSKRKATMCVAPNFAYQFVIDRVSDRHTAGLDLSALRLAFNGAEAVRPSTLRSFNDRFSPLGFDAAAFQPVYGMAENSLAATFPRAGDRWHVTSLEGRELVSVGTPLSGVTVAVVDDTNRPVEAGTVGAIRLRSPSLMEGYFRNEAATAQVLRDGWLETGDLGFVENGELYVTGRRKELIIKRGRNYMPDDLESVAVEAAKGRVIRAAAFGAPDDKEGTERIVMVLETRPVSEHERELLQREVGGALISAIGIGPDAIVVVPPRTIERTTSGKIRRATLRSRFLEGTLPSHGDVAAAPEEAEEG